MPHPKVAVEQQYTIAEVAEIMGVSPWTIRRRIADGTLRAYRFGRLLRIDGKHLAEFVAQ